MIPSPTASVWWLGPVPIRAYALCILTGIAVAGWWTGRRPAAWGGRPGDVLDVAMWGVPVGILGARLYHVITSPQAYVGPGGTPVSALRIWDGGMGMWGGFALGGVAAWACGSTRGTPAPARAVRDAAGEPIVKGVVHPTFLYEVLWCVLLALVILGVRVNTWVSALVLAGGVGRYLRAGSRGPGARADAAQRTAPGR